MKQLGILLIVTFCFASCGTKKKLAELSMAHEKEMDIVNAQLGKCGEDLNSYMDRLAESQREIERLKGTTNTSNNTVDLLRAQLDDCLKQRDKQVEQVGDLTVLSQAANDNIKETLGQLEDRDKYIKLLQAAKTKADSVNLALAINLKGVLKDGIADRDVEIKVDKTVVFVNLSDKMLYYSGSSDITPRAKEVLGKISKIIESRPNLEVMVEGYTDNVPIRNSCMKDNWDLSVKRATSVVRVLQETYNVDPNRLIAAGRGQYNQLADNATSEGRATNRRTRIIILPKLNEFYDLLNPDNAPE